MSNIRTSIWHVSLATIVALYISQSIPLYFFNVAIPSIFRSLNFDLSTIGLISVLYLPWAFKFLWASYVDSYYLARLGKRKTWLLFTQLGIVLLLVGLSSIDLSQQTRLFFILGFAISCFSATQDIAIDAYAVESCPKNKFNYASSAQSVGVAFGVIVGSAGMLWLYERLGWQQSVLILAGFVAILSLVLQTIKEPEQSKNSLASPSIKSFWRRSETKYLLLLIVVYRFVEAPAMAMVNPLLVDNGWSLSQIGLFFSVLAGSAGLLASITTGKWLNHIKADKALIHIAWFRTCAYFLLATCLYLGWVSNSYVLGGAVLLILAIRYMAMTALYAFFMQHCSKDQAGTDFTIFVCCEFLVFFIGGALSGFATQSLGYSNYYVLITLVSVLSIALSVLVLKKIFSIQQP